MEMHAVPTQSEELHFESCAVRTKIRGRTATILNIYRPPTGSFEIFTDLLVFNLKKISNNSDLVIVTGDLNINSNQDCVRTKILNDLFESFNLIGHITEPTRIHTNKNGVTSMTTIDYINSNLPEGTYDCCTVALEISDHMGTLLSINDANNKKPFLSTKREVRSLGRNSLDRFSKSLQREAWTYVYESKCADEAFDIFFSTFLRYFNENCPVYTKTVRKKNGYRGWVTEEVREKSNQMKNLHFITKYTNDEGIKRQYRIEKKNYKKFINQTKKKYFEDKIATSENPQKILWNIVNDKMGKKASEKPIALNINGEINSESDKVANEFAHYFTTSAKQKVDAIYGSQRNHASTSLYDKITSNTIVSSMYVAPVTPEEVLEVISRMKTKKSVGCDDIGITVIKAVVQSIINPLSDIFNLSVRCGAFPCSLKIAKVVPVFKRGNKNDHQNYRPVSVLSVFSKIFEKLMYIRLNSFIQKNKIITTSQYGYQPGKSTEDACIDFCNYVYGELDRGKLVVGIFFDLSIAFDTVQREPLLKKLHNLGIRGDANSWISSFLSKRKIRVKANGALSEVFDLNLGVVQGSVLGPFLFLLFINDLPNFLTEEHIVVFADDTALVVSAESPERLLDQVKVTMIKFQNWCKENQFIINMDKTVCINFQNKKKYLTQNDCQINNFNINLSENIKYLGTFLDKRLSWESTIDSICKKLNSYYYIILNLKHCFKEKNLINIYYSLCYSQLAYNIVLWGRSSFTNRIFVKQKMLLRLIFNLKPRQSCRNTFIHHKILTLTSLFIFKTVLYVKKNSSDFEFCGGINAYNTRNHDLLKTIQHRSALFEKSPIYTGITLYNKLPGGMKNISSLKLFRKTLKNLLTQKAYYTLSEFLEDKQLNV